MFHSNDKQSMNVLQQVEITKYKLEYTDMLNN